MNLNPLDLLSPLDGRYAETTAPLRDYFSEFAFLRDRVRVELDYLAALSKTGLVRPLTDSESRQIQSISQNFSISDAEAIRSFEEQTRHDVKAIEYFLREKLEATSLSDLLPWLHFGLTSEDVNNIAQAISLRDSRDGILQPALENVVNHILEFVKTYRALPMLARTHGQPAVPTTLGKEFAVYLARLKKALDEIAKHRFEAKLTGAEKQLIAAQPTSDLTAYDLYLKGRLLWSKRGGENLRQAIAFYEQAIVRDPNYALAYAAMAEAYVLLPFYAGMAQGEVFPKAKAAALKALQLDDKLAGAHTGLAWALCYDFDMVGSISEFQRAIALNPNYATAHQWYGRHPLTALGRLDEAIAEGKRAIELDPLSPVINTDLGQTLFMARRYDEAIAQLRKALEIDPTFYYAHYTLGMALQLKGDVPTAIAEYTKAQQLSDDLRIQVLVANIKALSGDKDAAKQMLAELEEVSRHRYVRSFWRTLLCLSLGKRDEAIRWLEKGVADHEGLEIAWIKVDPMLDPLRGDPRFEALVQKVVGPAQK